MNNLRRALCCILLCFISLQIEAQFTLAAGPELSFPLMYNDEVGSYHHALGAFGIHATVNYTSPNISFFPSLLVSSAAERLPVLKVGGTAVNIKFLQSNIILYANLKKDLDKRQLSYGFGIGAAYFNGNKLVLSGDRNNISSVSSNSANIKVWAPTFNVKCEYIMPMSDERPLDIGFGFNLQYIHFFDNNIIYNVHIVDNQYNYASYAANFKGNVFLPCFYLNVYYRFGRSND